MAPTTSPPTRTSASLTRWMRAIMTRGLCGIRPGQSVRFGAVFLLAETPMQGRGRGSAVHAGLAIAAAVGFAGTAWAQGAAARSEEHTSELQSQSNLVCRLLLEKKKKT